MKAKEVILITGATGFIGSHLAKDLAEKGESIKCLVRRSSPKAAVQFLSGLGAELITGDLTDEKSLGAASKGFSTLARAVSWAISRIPPRMRPIPTSPKI